MSDTKRINRIRKARTQLVMNQPFFGNIVLRMPMVYTDQVPTMATDGNYLFFNPKFVDKLSDMELQGVICHEAMHAALLHPQRKGNKNHEKWNAAGDFVINFLLHESNITLPDPHLYEEQYGGMTTEAVYNKLPDHNHEACGCIIFNPEGMETPTDEDGNPIPGMYGDAADAELESLAKIMLDQAMAAAKAEGKLPGSLKDYLESHLIHKVDWRSELQQFFTIVSKDDFSWSRPSRRYAAAGMYLPSLHSHALGTIAVAVDTSASVSKEELQQFCAEISAILGDTRPRETYVIYCDHHYQRHDLFMPEDFPLTGLRVDGRGGTSFQPPFRWLEEQGIQPQCLIYLTDMECGDFAPTPDYPVMWVSTTKGPWNPPYGKVIYMGG